jgi:hypothetical protein
LTTRDEAIAAGLGRFDGEGPCPKGHRGERYTKNGKCVACVAIISARRSTKGNGTKRTGFNGSENRSKGLAQRVARRKDMPLPKLREADVVPLNLPLIELRYGACKYPTTEGNGRHLFCGLSAVASSASYCPDHAAICFAPVDRFRDKKLFGDPNSSLIPRFQFGTSNVIYGVKEIGRESPAGSLLLPLLNERQFKIEVIEGKLKVSSQIADDNGHLIVELIQNEWKVAPPPNSWDRNYSDDALEVRDASGDVVLQIRLLPDRIQLQGVWWVDIGYNGMVRIIIRGNIWDGAQTLFVPKNSKNPAPKIDPMFRYPSEHHLGQLVRNP